MQHLVISLHNVTGHVQALEQFPSEFQFGPLAVGCKIACRNHEVPHPKSKILQQHLGLTSGFTSRGKARRHEFRAKEANRGTGQNGT